MPNRDEGTLHETRQRIHNPGAVWLFKSYFSFACVMALKKKKKNVWRKKMEWKKNWKNVRNSPKSCFPKFAKFSHRKLFADTAQLFSVDSRWRFFTYRKYTRPTFPRTPWYTWSVRLPPRVAWVLCRSYNINRTSRSKNLRCVDVVTISANPRRPPSSTYEYIVQPCRLSGLRVFFGLIIFSKKKTLLH